MKKYLVISKHIIEVWAKDEEDAEQKADDNSSDILSDNFETEVVLKKTK